MALRNAVMAALIEGEASGYDLAKDFDASVANYWMATPQQLYRELDRMAEEGLIHTRVVEQERRPNKRLHSLTPAGWEALRAFTARTPKPTAIRDELLVQVRAIDVCDTASIRASVADSKLRAETKLARYERGRAAMLGDRNEQTYLLEAEAVGPYLTLLRGIAFERENIRWADIALATIDRRETTRHRCDSP
ncbi:PadR family transcriptional regulator [Nocardia sp. NBC_01377]|uniref:PadR family transcriptional regulator n=1 Tax=Nocardia sp. NBC_01377 TaxID=2903595 RepID=UPI003255FAB4